MYYDFIFLCYFFNHLVTPQFHPVSPWVVQTPILGTSLIVD